MMNTLFTLFDWAHNCVSEWTFYTENSDLMRYATPFSVLVKTLLTKASLIQMTHPSLYSNWSFNIIWSRILIQLMGLDVLDVLDWLPASLGKLQLSFFFLFSLNLMNNKYFAVFLPSLGIDEKLFHLGELIMKIMLSFVYMLVTIKR